jgi:hypothetical protein
MPLQTSGPISKSEIVTEFASRLPAGPAQSISSFRSSQILLNILSKSATDPISYSDFYGKANYTINVGADSLSVRQGETLLINTATLLANDTDDLGLPLTITGVQNPVGGTVTINGTTIEFTSTGLAGNPASFEYLVNNTQDTVAATVNITVTPLLDAEAYMFSTGAAAIAATNDVNYVPPTVTEIFNTWARLDGANYYEGTDPNKSTNADAWQLLANPERVLMPLNVEPANGFISPDQFENYTFQATLQSTSTDNDSNGLIVAFVRENGVNHVLALMATKAGAIPLSGYALVYYQDSMWYLDDGSSGYNFTVIEAPSFGLDTSGGWESRQIRLKIQREGNILRCYASQFNDTSSYLAGSEIVFDMTSRADTQRFTGPKPYGYMTFSQPDSSYVDIQFDGGINEEVIYDAENNRVYDWDSNTSTWVLSSDTIQDRLGYIRMTTNPNTTERFRIKQSTVEYLGKSNGAVFNATKVLNEQQNIYINTITGGAGVGNGVQVVGLYEYDVEETNLLNGLPTLTTTGAYSSNANTVGSGTYFSDNGLDVSTLNMLNGTVVFDNGTVGNVSAITDGSITYTVTTDFEIYDETI